MPRFARQARRRAPVPAARVFAAVSAAVFVATLARPACLAQAQAAKPPSRPPSPTRAPLLASQHGRLLRSKVMLSISPVQSQWVRS